LKKKIKMETIFFEGLIVTRRKALLPLGGGGESTGKNEVMRVDAHRRELIILRKGKDRYRLNASTLLRVLRDTESECEYAFQVELHSPTGNADEDSGASASSSSAETLQIEGYTQHHFQRLEKLLQLVAASAARKQKSDDGPLSLSSSPSPSPPSPSPPSSWRQLWSELRPRVCLLQGGVVLLRGGVGDSAAAQLLGTAKVRKGKIRSQRLWAVLLEHQLLVFKSSASGVPMFALDLVALPVQCTAKSLSFHCGAADRLHLSFGERIDNEHWAAALRCAADASAARIESIGSCVDRLRALALRALDDVGELLDARARDAWQLASSGGGADDSDADAWGDAQPQLSALSAHCVAFLVNVHWSLCNRLVAAASSSTAAESKKRKSAKRQQRRRYSLVGVGSRVVELLAAVLLGIDERQHGKLAGSSAASSSSSSSSSAAAAGSLQPSRRDAWCPSVQAYPLLFHDILAFERVFVMSMVLYDQLWTQTAASAANVWQSTSEEICALLSRPPVAEVPAIFDMFDVFLSVDERPLTVEKQASVPKLSAKKAQRRQSRSLRHKSPRRKPSAMDIAQYLDVVEHTPTRRQASKAEQASKIETPRKRKKKRHHRRHRNKKKDKSTSSQVQEAKENVEEAMEEVEEAKENVDVEENHDDVQAEEVGDVEQSQDTVLVEENADDAKVERDGNGELLFPLYVAVRRHLRPVERPVSSVLRFASDFGFSDDDVKRARSARSEAAASRLTQSNATATASSSRNDAAAAKKEMLPQRDDVAETSHRKVMVRAESGSKVQRQQTMQLLLQAETLRERLLDAQTRLEDAERRLHDELAMTLCAACATNLRGAVLVPCMHFRLCIECARSLRVCPETNCQSNIRSVIETTV
jgi:Zinc finger, C3HC4 type (RING finger)